MWVGGAAVVEAPEPLAAGAGDPQGAAPGKALEDDAEEGEEGGNRPQREPLPPGEINGKQAQSPCSLYQKRAFFLVDLVVGCVHVVAAFRRVAVWRDARVVCVTRIFRMVSVQAFARD